MRSILLLRRNVVHLFLFSGLLLFNQVALAQATKTISGTVVNAASGEPVAGASVRVKGAATVGGTTGVSGEFTITVPAATTTLVISSIGFRETEVPAVNAS